MTSSTLRQFQVRVLDPRKRRWLIYPPIGGPAALRGMETLSARGFKVEAVTTANELTEHLSLAQMREAVI